MIILVCILKLLKYLLVPLLSNVINERISDSIFPDNLQIAEVVPIFSQEMTKSQTDISANTPVKNKKSCTQDWILLIKNKLLSQQQYGFHNNHATSLDITDLYKNLLCAVFLDVRKSFDSINYSMLL